MLFPYTYVPHKMERMQEFIDFIFHEVWCKAPIGEIFHPELFKGNPDLKEVMSEFGFSSQAAERGKVFYKDVKTIYELFELLSPQEIQQLKLWYQGNNDLEKVCANDPAAQLARYADIAPLHQYLGGQLAIFFKELYSQSLLDLAALRAKIGDINDHYRTFVTANNVGKCPFCGTGDIKGLHYSKREAYDHYLPKALYPFNSINFFNLAPACNECNSTYKLSKDPAHSATGRRKAFYPYTTKPYVIELEVTLQHSAIEKLTPTNISLFFRAVGLDEEIATWKDLYGIEERYKAMFCEENYGKYWLMQTLDEWQWSDRSPADFLTTLDRQAIKKPYSECNFLKKPFLDACQQIGIF